ncbi:MAG: hypothetical protein R3F03_13035 [Opitutaceae bacterium]
MGSSPLFQAGLRIGLFSWILLAIWAGRQEWLGRMPPSAIPALVLTLTTLLFMAYRRITALREWLDQIDLRWILALHLTRFVGFYFIWLHHRGLMPEAFAIPVGIGDIVTAALAGLIIMLPLAPATRLRAITIWNMIGMMDMIFVLLTAARLALSHAPGMQVMTYLPLSLLPTFLVPLIIASHLVIFVRLAKPRT